MQALTAFFMSVFMMFITLIPLPAGTGRALSSDGTEKLTMPMLPGNDPWFIEHDGRYYYSYSIGTGVAVRSSDTVGGLQTGEETIAYRAPSGTMYSGEYWAPELHYINGEWFIYVAADDGRNENHRMYAMRCDSPTGQFEFAGKVSDPSDRWAIDGTVLQYGGELYFIWSGWEGETDSRQNLYIAHMSDPVTIDSERVCISVPERRWEKKGAAINEGPEVLTHGGDVYVVYSASGSWTDDYCLGMLRLTGKDPLDGRSWSKCPVSVFAPTKTVFGPGHCSFLMSEDGDSGYIIYHANSVSGTGWSGRQVRVQPFGFVFGVPVFGRPVDDGTVISVN